MGVDPTKKKKADIIMQVYETIILSKKCSNTEIFLVRRPENADQKNLHIWTRFMQCNPYLLQ